MRHESAVTQLLSRKNTFVIHVGCLNAGKTTLLRDIARVLANMCALSAEPAFVPSQSAGTARTPEPMEVVC